MSEHHDEPTQDVAIGYVAGDDATTSSEVPPAVVDERPPGLYISPKTVLISVAIVLLIILIALVIFLLLQRSSNPSAHVTDKTAAGLKAELVIEGPGRGAKPTFSRPMGAAWSPNGNRIYVADSENNRVCIFDDSGGFIGEFGGFGIAKPLKGAKPNWDPGELNYPVDVAVDDNGEVYVADFYNDSISVFDKEGEFLRRFPEPDKVVGKGGSGANGTGIAVTSIALSGDEVYATDSYQVVVFSKQGQFLRQFGRPGSGVGGFDRPNGIAVGEDNVIYVSDSNNSRVVALAANGRQQWAVGERIPAGTGATADDALVLPRGLTVTDDGSLLVADPLAQRLTSISSSGKLGSSMGVRGTSPAQLNFPNDVDWENERLLIADRANDRVQVVRIVGE